MWWDKALEEKGIFYVNVKRRMGMKALIKVMTYEATGLQGGNDRERGL
jgi:hypothetical protein